MKCTYVITKDNFEKYRDMLNQIVISKYILRNRMTINNIKYKEQKKYLEAYQKLYVKEALKNVRRGKECVMHELPESRMDT